MTILLSTLTIIVVVLFFATRVATYTTYGPLIKDEVWAPVLEKQIQKGSELNPFDSNIINIGNLPYISNIQFDVLGGYHINCIGVVPRWSKSHKLIKAEFDKRKREKLEKHK